MKTQNIFTTAFALTSVLSANIYGKTSNIKCTCPPVSTKSDTKSTSTKKNTTADKAVTTTKNNNSTSTGNRNLYSIPSNNVSSLLTTKMNELEKRHKRISASGTAHEKKAAALEKKLLASFNNWKGTTYRFGGDSKSGIDCSALTRRVYREVFNHELPRISTQQVEAGKKVSLKNLKPGDILFFKTDGTTNHTAVYIGNSLFINASSSKGVVISSLQSPYWEKYFKYGVRVV